MSALPPGTRHALPGTAWHRWRLQQRLVDLYRSWGYERVEVPALEVYDPAHPRAGQSFKLTDRGGSLLALRSDFTPALARLARLNYKAAARGEEAVRLQYGGTVWHAINPDVARTREFTQVGLELIGASCARADAELIHLAREGVREVGLRPRVEVGNPAFVRALFDLAGVPAQHRTQLASAIDRKEESALRKLVGRLDPPAELRRALLRVPDLYGGPEVLAEARRLAPWPETTSELDRLEAILAEFEDAGELLLELGMARRLSYYTGVTFRAYTFDFGQPLLGGGRYDGALLPFAAGFTLGLERLLAALPPSRREPEPLVLSLDDAGARTLRAAGVRVVRALTPDAAEARREAARLGAAYLLTGAGLEPLGGDRSEWAALAGLLEGRGLAGGGT